VQEFEKEYSGRGYILDFNRAKTTITSRLRHVDFLRIKVYDDISAIYGHQKTTVANRGTTCKNKVGR
jgi:hypothetical protein